MVLQTSHYLQPIRYTHAQHISSFITSVAPNQSVPLPTHILPSHFPLKLHVTAFVPFFATSAAFPLKSPFCHQSQLEAHKSLDKNWKSYHPTVYPVSC
jgi:hypothetical protein